MLLPDGSMVAVGGGVGSNSSQNRLWTATPDQMQVELWDPSTKTWSLGPSQLENRAYHSTAILLPDASVLSAGDDRNGGFDRDTAEIYKPPYLFKGARPTISSAPAQIAYNGTFNVDTPDTNVTKAVLIAPGAATHAVDMNQRYVPLVVAQRTGGVTLTAPANSNIALARLLHALPRQRERRALRREVGQAERHGAAAAGRDDREGAGEAGDGLELGERQRIAPGFGNDGTVATRWSSSFLDNQWWQVDLGSTRTITSVEATFNMWAWPRTYTVSASTNGTTFTTLANETLTTWGTKTSTFAPFNARYVRITGVTRGTSAGTSIEEAKVFGPAQDTTGNQPPSAVVSGSPSSGAAPLTVAFGSAGSSDPDGTISAYSWDLNGDGTFGDATVASPSFQYTTAGTYSVRLRVTDNQGAQTTSAPFTVTVTGGGGGTVVEKAKGKPASASSTEGAAWAAAASANDGDINSRWSSNFTDNQWWQVDLGAATPVSSVDITFCGWAWPSTYTVSVSTDGTTWSIVANETLTSGGSKQRTSTFSQVNARYVRITGLTRGTQFGTSIFEAKVNGPSSGGGGNQAPVAQAAATPTSGTAPLTVAFSSAGSSDPDGSIAAYAWDLNGDGQYTESTAANPSFQYTTAGTYTARLRVTDNQGAQTTSSPLTINVTAPGNQPPSAVVSGSPSSGAAPLTVAFGSAGSSDPDGTISAYSWDLNGDGTFGDATVASPSFQYTTAGTYSVRLRVTDNQGAQTTSAPFTVTVTGGGGGTVVEKAKGKPASASSTEGAAWAAAASANDGDINSRWSSNFTDNQWWQVDLGAATPVSSVDITFCGWAWPSTYTVSVSTDGTTWSIVANETLTSGGSKQRTSTFSQVNARYVRITGLTRGTQFGTSIFEAKVNGPSSGGGGNQAPVAQAAATPSQRHRPPHRRLQLRRLQRPRRQHRRLRPGTSTATASTPSPPPPTPPSNTPPQAPTPPASASPTTKAPKPPPAPSPSTSAAPGNQPPSAVVSGSPSSGAAPLTVAFGSAGSSDPDGTISAYSWDLNGDGTFGDATVASPSFQYTTAGTSRCACG